MGWWKNSNYFSAIASVAQELLDTRQTSEGIYALGQSAAWIVRAAELLVEQKAGLFPKIRFGYIPFSGAFAKPCSYEINRNNRNKLSFKLDCPPSQTLQEYYRGHLRRTCSFLDQLENNQAIALVDFGESGKGMASFLSLFPASNIQPHFLKYQSFPAIYEDEDKNLYSFAASSGRGEVVQDLSKSTNLMLAIEDKLFNCTIQATKDLPPFMNGGTGSYSDRKVPYFPADYWDMDEMGFPDNRSIVNFIDRQLRLTIQSQARSAPTARHIAFNP